MKSKKMIITSIWVFMLVTIVMLNLDDFGISFFGYLVLFFIALTSSASLELLIPDTKEPEIELLNELQNIKSKLNKLTTESESSS